MNVFQTNRKAILGIGGSAVLGSVALIFFAPGLIGYFVGAAVLVGLVWIGAQFLVRRMKRGKQRRFDAGIAAREGIDDRKREWASWTSELEQQGIDRYDLPFYLLVGEPQSGKSVLLQNSDLTFPFGQSRLSGIGGTRGCDWWFTEEAVVLDLAGRLFTHEGGASDEAEWSAFLEMLSSYRPLCPANGLMLVIPCDSLLKDSREDANRKANKIQNALLTLTNKLQAQLPIYVILTKGDRIFGFAETVHRLEAEHRHQMFGWSRPAEQFEAPFDMVEVREAFAAMVARARKLRDTMLASVRLPEGINEVDRMYAFPEELQGIASNLEVYLKRIFSESTLVDRLYFRGFYLTSGLQTGTPIANVCAELYGSTGEADKRDLAALFTKQQAYFIKDLIRRRVFSERGLVRPTEARVSRSRRNAWLGYGAAAFIAVTSTVWSVSYVVGEYDAGSQQLFATSIERARVVANQRLDATPADLLASLDATFAAQQVAPRSLERAGVSRADSFANLYVTLCDRRLVPALRRAAESEARARVDAGFEGADAHTRFLTLGRQLSTLLAGFDPKDRDALDRIAPLFPAGLGDWQLAFTRRATFEAPIPRSERTPPVAGVADELGLAARGLGALWPKTLIGGEPLQIDGAAGDLVTWHSAQLSSDALEVASVLGVERDRARFLAEAERFHRAATRLRARLAPGAAERARWSLANSSEVDTALDALEQARAEFLVATGQPKPTAWEERQTVDRFAQTVVFGATDPAAPRTKPEAPARLRSEALIAATAPTTLAALSPEAWSPAALAALPSTIATVRELAQRAGDDGAPLALRVLRAKCEFVAADHLGLAGSWDALLTALGGTPGGAAPSGTEMRRLLASGLRHLVELRREIAAFGAEATVFDAWQRRIDELLVVGLDATKAAITREDDVAASDQELLRALHGAWSLGGVFGARFRGLAQSAADTHVGNVQSELARRWSTPGSDQALPALDVVLRELDEHLLCIPPAGEGEFVDTVVVQWLKNRVSLLLAGRLEQFVAELGARHDKLLEEIRCEALLARGGPELDVRGLAGLARTARGLLDKGEIGAWQSRVAGLFDAATVGPQLDRLAARAPLAAVAAQLRTMCSRVDSLEDFAKRSHRLEVLTWCLGELEKLETSKASEAGPGLARVLFDLRQRWRSRVVDAEPSASVVDWYLDRLEGALDARSVTVLRRKYLEELASSVKLAGNLAAALRVAPEMSPGERRAILGRVDAARLAIAEELGNLVFGE
ncbi:MAG: hypothetical protein IT457_22595, partial [Planctomycetes bacterium]|nr:hypothetical protein [Planctomycetota bacterium]